MNKRGTWMWFVVAAAMAGCTEDVEPGVASNDAAVDAVDPSDAMVDVAKEANEAAAPEGAPVEADAPSDHLSETAAPDAEAGVDSDAGCPTPQIAVYVAPGCGAEAHPVCGGPSGDACAISFCSCTGQTVVGCDFVTEPFAYRGPCCGGADGSSCEGGSDGSGN